MFQQVPRLQLNNNCPKKWTRKAILDDDDDDDDNDGGGGGGGGGGTLIGSHR